ncbi:cadherin-like beta sandwich domain-containing protein [Paenibacillus gorillae]|uniref:cadherin-like beta sandwich domain-containing protein n=1 Tax=Paenibacillus gorillae TaxID=1243662 RepID=UPI0005A752EB|nr:cadherin-like beta sandwich domain-containing protein [Paenibacillus gorillae]
MRFSIYRVLLIQLIGMMLLASVPLHPAQAAPGFAGGDGSPGSPYLIENASQFNEIRNDINASYRLTQDIDLSSYASLDGGKGWRPIEGYFSGQLDGDGYRITGLSIHRGDENNIGLFQSIWGKINRLSIVQAEVTGNDHTGILSGDMYMGTVEDVHVSGQVEGGSQVGGLIGGIQDSQVQGTGASVSVKGTSSHVGGLIGASSNSANTTIAVADSYAEGNVEGLDTYVGGLIGLLFMGRVERSYASGNVAGANETGGLVGTAYAGSVIRDSYALGKVSGDKTVGGFAGHIYESSISQSYSAGTVTGNTNVGGFAGYTYNWTSSQLYWNSDAYEQAFGFSASSITGISGSNLLKASNYGGFDFSSKWAIAEGKSYPYLRGNAPLWLNNLTLTPNAGTAGNIAPAWQSFINQYDLSVTSSVTSLTAVPVVANAGAVVEVSGVNGLTTGTNTATITIKDSKGVRSPNVYVIHIHKLTSSNLSSDASLSDLRINGAPIAGFSGSTLNYSIVVPNSSTAVTITATPNHPDAVYTVIGGTALNLGDNTVTVKVTASDGTTRTYTLTINRNRFAGGNGTEASPYLIGNASQFNEIRNDYQKVYRLIADIDLSAYATANGGQGWEPIYFEGILQGNGHAIKGLNINRPSENVIGLFQYIYLGSVSDLNIVQANVVGGDDVGILAGLHNSNTITNVRTSGSVSGNSNVGGLVGSLHSGTIKASSSAATVIGSGDAIGGLVGQSYSAIETSYTEGNVHGLNKVGGLVGEAIGSTISNSFAIGEVKADTASAGGLIGRSNQGTYTNLYAAGKIQGGSAVGGLVGTRSNSTFTRGYWNPSTTGQILGAGSGTATGLTGYTTAQMKSSSSFSGWDFSSIWSIASTTTPYLRSAPLPLWLTGLTVTGDTGAAVNVSAFDNLTRSFTVGVAADVHSVTITGTAIDPLAVVTAGGGMNLSSGSNPVVVTVKGADGYNSLEYRLNVMRANPSIAGLSDITLSSGTLSPAFAEATTGYSVSVPFATSTLAVTPYVSNAGSTVKINGTAAVSGQPSGNIALTAGTSTVITIEVTSQDGTNTKSYTLTVTRAAGSANANLSALTTTGGALSPTFSAATTSYTAAGVSNTTTSVTVRPTTADSSATLAVSVNGGTAVSVTSGQNSSALALNVGANTIEITVTAQDGTIKRYSISVTRAASTVTTLSGLTVSSGALSPGFTSTRTTYTATAASSYSSVTVKPTATFAGATITVSVNGSDPVVVASGTDSVALPLNAGVNTIEIKVLAQDAVSSRTYTITLTRSASTASDLTSFSFEGLSPAVIGTINGTNVSLTVPYGTNVGQLAATFANSAASTVTVGGVTQTSGVTTNNFTAPVLYKVTAENGTTTKTYTVTVTVAASTEKELMSFSFAGLTPAVTGTISGNNITLTVPYGTDVSTLVSTFSSSAGSTVKVGTVAQVSGVTANDYTSPVVYTVTAQDGSTQDYTVTVMVASNMEKELTSFSFAGLTPAVVGTISGNDVTLTVPYGTDVSALVSTFSSSAGSTVKVGTVAQTSGVTANDYTSPVVYTVTAQDGSTQDYTVTVAIASNTEKELTSFSFGGLTPVVVGTISGNNVTLTVPYGTDISALVSTYSSSAGSTVKVGNVTQVSGVTANDFASPVIYTVTAQDGSIKSYTVSVTIADNPSPGGGNGGNGGSGGTGGGGGTDTGPKDYDEIIIKAGQSGSFKRAGEISLSIPSGVFEQDATLQVRKITDTSKLVNHDERLVGPVYEVLKKSSGMIMKKMLITLQFDPALIKENEKPAIFYYDEVNKKWIELGGTVEGNSVTVETNQFAKFAVLPVRKNSDGGTTSPQFTDIEGHWAAAAIIQAASIGITSGYADGTFRPNAPITRAEFAVLLIKALQIQGEGSELRFTDNKAIGNWAKHYIALAVKEGIINGYSDGTFRPHGLITRAEMAVMLANTQHTKPEATVTTTFADDTDIPAWSKGAIKEIAEQGIVQGRGGNRYVPMATASRAEAIVVLLKLIQNAE